MVSSTSEGYTASQPMYQPSHSTEQRPQKDSIDQIQASFETSFCLGRGHMYCIPADIQLKVTSGPLKTKCGYKVWHTLGNSPCGQSILLTELILSQEACSFHYWRKLPFARELLVAEALIGFHPTFLTLISGIGNLVVSIHLYIRVKVLSGLFNSLFPTFISGTREWRRNGWNSSQFSIEQVNKSK